MQAFLYHWDLKPSSAEEFISAWRNVTLDLNKKTGSRGSRLHKCDDGSYLAYTLWDSAEHRTEAFSSGIPQQKQIMKMRSCTKHRHPEMQLEVTDDLLLPIPKDDPNVFAAFYHWMINPDLIVPFKEIWHRVTLELRAQYDVQGSRLHLADDAHWVAYAIWPSKEMRDHAFSHPLVSTEEKKIMRAALMSNQVEIPSHVIEDFLMPIEDLPSQ